MSFNFTDAIDDILSRPAGEVRQSTVEYQHVETCRACRGTGKFRSYSGRTVGDCFKCKGAGKKTFKTSAATRAKATVARVEKKLSGIEAFRAANPEVFAWLQTNTSFEFAVSLNQALHQYGDLTDGQLNAAKKCVAKLAESKAAREAAAPAVEGVDRLKEAFNTAIAKATEKGRTLRKPRITIGGMVISPAGGSSKNAGALYVKSAGAYLGKVANGRFFAAYECTDEQQAKVLAFVADPKAAAIAYGQETGVCCICNATLTNKASIEAGIGPICAANFGW